MFSITKSAKSLDMDTRLASSPVYSFATFIAVDPEPEQHETVMRMIVIIAIRANFSDFISYLQLSRY